MRRSSLNTKVVTIILNLLIALSGLIIVNQTFQTVGGESYCNEGNTLYVDDDAPGGGNGSLNRPFNLIQLAIDNASDGDTVRVYNGTYMEYLNIGKSIELIGNGSKETVIRGIGKTESYISQIGHYTNDTHTINYLDITIEEGLGYIPNGARGFDIVDISDPGNPILVARNHTGGGARHIAVKDGYAYIANGDEGLAIYNISNPTDPQWIGKIDTNETAWGVAVEGNYAYIADLNDGLVVVDISNQRDPHIVGEVANDSRSMKVILLDNYAYVADDYRGLTIIDISEPTEPRIVGNYDSIGSCYNLDIQGDFAFIADSRSGMEILDISNRTDPTHVGRFTIDGDIRDVVAVGDHAYLADYNNGLIMVDISNKSSPCTLATIATEGDSRSIAYLNGIVYIPDWENGLMIVNVSINDPVVVRISASNISLRHLSVLEGSGIIIGADNINIQNCIISGNSYGIRIVNGSANVIIQDNLIQHNSAFGMYASSNENIIVKAYSNYWGSARGPYHKHKNSGGNGNAVSDNVLFEPWMIMPPGIKSTIYVATTGDDDTGDGSRVNPYRTIQKGVNEASIWETIRVFAGTYEENVVIDKEGIQVVGNGSAGTVIDGRENGDVVFVTADWVNISGFRIYDGGGDDFDAGIELYKAMHCNISSNNCTFGHKGIYLRQSDYNTIIDNSVDRNSDEGIQIDSYSDNNRILNNTCINQEVGIYIQSHHNSITRNYCYNNQNAINIHGSGAHNNTVEENRCTSNDVNGLFVGGACNHVIRNEMRDNSLGINLYYCDNNSIDSNIIIGNMKGINFDHADENILKANSIISNEVGLYLGYFSRNNIANGNDIYSNQIGINASNSGGETIDAKLNYWGNVSGPYHPTWNSLGNGDNVTENVIFHPWLRHTSTYTPRTIHVSTYSNDTTGNGSAEQPYRTVQKAVAEANEWDTVRVFAGVYEENVVMDQEGIRIVGNGSGETVIRGIGNGDVKLYGAGHCDTPGLACRVAVAGDYAYVADESNGLVIIDISDPGNTTIVGHYDTGNSVRDVAIRGDYAYVADSSNGLVVFDVSDPQDPQLVGHYDTAGHAHSVALRGDYAYVADSSNGLVIFDVSDPQDPQWVGHYNTAGFAKGIAIYGDHAYIADEGNGLVIINVSDPANPMKEGHYETDSNARDVAVCGNYAYVAADENDLVLVDISDPGEPVRTGQCNIVGYAKGVAVSREYAFVSNYYYGISVIDISHPDDPLEVSRYDIPGATRGVAVCGDYAFVASNNYGIVNIEIDAPPDAILDITQPYSELTGITVCHASRAGIRINADNVNIENCGISGNADGIRLTNGASDVCITNSVLCENSRFGIYANDNDDITVNATHNYWGAPSGPYNLAKNPDGYGDNVSNYVDFHPWLGKPPGPKQTLYVTIYGNDTTGNGSTKQPYRTIMKAIDEANEWDTIRVFAGLYQENVVIEKEGVEIIGNGTGKTVISGIGRCGVNMSMTGHIETMNNAQSVALSGDYAYIADDGNGLVVVNVSDPENPQYVGGYNTSGLAYGIAVCGDYAYIADDGNGLVVVNVSDPENPQYAGGYNTSGLAYGIAMSGDYAYIADDGNGLVVVDVSDPENPKYAGRCDTDGHAYDVAVSGDYVYIADNDKGLLVVDISDPEDPREAGKYDTPGQARGVAVTKEYAYIADQENGLVVVDVSDPADLQLSATYKTAHNGYRVELNEDYLFVAGSELVVLDVRHPEIPQFSGGYDNAGPGRDVAVRESYAYIADGENGLVICEIQYLPKAVLNVTTDYCKLSGFTIRNGSSTGVLIDGACVEIRNCDIQDNSIGIRVINSSRNVTVHHNNIYHNTGYGIDASGNGATVVRADHNWWGQETGPYHETDNSEGLGDNITNLVIFEPWLEDYHGMVYSFSLSEGVSKPISPGETITFSLTITNTGWAENDTFLIEVHSPENWYSYLVDNLITIESNSTLTANISVTAPHNSQSGFSAPIEITVHSAGNISFRKSVEFTADVRQEFDFDFTAEFSRNFTPGSENPVNILIDNLGNGADEFTIVVNSLPDGWQTNIRSAHVWIPAFSGDAREFLITPSTDSRAGEYTVNFSVVSPEAAKQWISIEIEIPEIFNISCTVETAGKGFPGVAILHEFTILNKGNTDDIIFISGENSVLDTEIMMVPWNGSGTFNVSVQLPAIAYPGDSVHSNITIFHGKDKQMTVLLNTTVLEKHNMDIETPSSISMEPGTTISFEINLSNTGNVPENLTLNITSPDDGITIEFAKKENITIPAFGRIPILLNITISSKKEYAGKEFGIILKAGNFPETTMTITVSSEYHDFLVVDGGFVKFVNGMNHCSLVLKNNGTVNETVVIESEAPAGWDVSVSSSFVRVLPGKIQEVDIIIGRVGGVPSSGNFIITVSTTEDVSQILIPVPPIAVIDIPTNVLRSHHQIEFTSNCSNCSDYSWEIDGLEYTGKSVIHTFYRAGEYEISLIISSGNGIKDRVLRTITIENSVPTAKFTVISEKGRLLFNATNSTDSDGEIIEYRWEIDGKVFHGKDVTYSYAEAGEYSVKLTVVDNIGDSNQITENVTVRKENSLSAFSSDPDGDWIYFIIMVLVVIVIALIFMQRNMKRQIIWLSKQIRDVETKVIKSKNISDSSPIEQHDEWKPKMDGTAVVKSANDNEIKEPGVKTPSGKMIDTDSFKPVSPEIEVIDVDGIELDDASEETGSEMVSYPEEAEILTEKVEIENSDVMPISMVDDEPESNDVVIEISDHTNDDNEGPDDEIE